MQFGGPVLDYWCVIKQNSNYYESYDSLYKKENFLLFLYS